MKSVIVIGADTGVGKTVVCASLLKAFYGSAKVAYWKPIQAGTMVANSATIASNTATARNVTGSVGLTP